jgi:menaquinone-dependent protoporphyrinogen oxidase
MTDTSRKVLVAYASWAGSTADVAERIAEVLNGSGFAAEAVRAKDVRDLSSYDAVVLGTAVHAGKLHPDALKFARRNAADLGSKPFAAFVVCLAMKGSDEKARATAAAYLEPVRQQVKPLSEGLFAGAYDPQKLDFVLRQIMKMIKAPPGDFRKWDDVEAWASSLAPLFADARTAGGR